MFDELQALLDRLGEQGVTLRYASRQLVSKDKSDPQPEPRPVGHILYLLGFREGEAPEEMVLPKRMNLM